MIAMERDRSRWRGGALSVRLDYFSKRLVVHPDIVNIKADLTDKEETSRLCGSGEGVLILGEPGAGKTTLATAISEWWPDVVHPEKTLRTVVSMRIPRPCTSSNLVKALLFGLGDLKWDSDRERVARDRALFLMDSCRTRFLVVDNFQDVPERRGVAGVRVIGNWFRDIRDDARVVLVLLGTKEAADVTLFNDQVKRRVMTTRQLRYFGIETQQDRARWLRLLHEIDMELPLADTSGLVQGNVPARLLVATNGIFDYLHKLLVAAVKIAVRDGRESLSMEDFQRAYVKCHGDIPEGTNPFDESFKVRRLDNEGEPFFRPVPPSRSALRGAA